MTVMALIVGLALAAAPAESDAIKRLGAAASPISASVEIPAGFRTVYISGTVPDAVKDAVPAGAGTGAKFGDTEAQTKSVLTKIQAQLRQHHMDMGNVVMMRVFLVRPAGQDRMDFAGMMRGYSAFFGTTAQPNKTARSTMEVAGLVNPDWLVEIEVTAAAR